MNARSNTPLAEAEAIDHICCQFETAWQAGSRPNLDAVLQQLPASLHDRTLLELIPIEIHYCQQQNLPLDSQEWFRLYPHLTAELERFFEAPRTQLTVDTNEIETFTAATAVPLLPGYEVESRVGQGGMAVVYLARDLKLNRQVAIKMILGAERATPEDRIRMRLEAEAIARLHHPNIVELHALLEIEGLPVLVMNYLPGGTLHLLIQQQRLSSDRIASLMESLARAIHHAHQRGIIHRDLKPGNILLDADGVPKITDFGMAKQLDLDKSLTRTGIIMGTPAYLAPEQANGESVGTAADLHALGVILFEMLTGSCPFRGENLAVLLEQIRHGTPVFPVNRERPVPRDLATICLKCLRKNPEERYTSALELAHDLQRFREGKPIHARPVGWGETLIRWCRRNPAAAVLVLILLVGVFAISLDVIGSRVEANRRARDRQTALDQLETVTTQVETQPLNRDRFDDARAEFRRVSSLISDSHQTSLERFQRLKDRLERVQRDRDLVHRGEEIRYQHDLSSEKRAELQLTETMLSELFETAYSIRTADLETTAQRIRESTLRDRLLGILDNWAVIRRNLSGNDDPFQTRLIELLALAAPEHAELRRALHRRDRTELSNRVNTTEIETLPTPTLALIASVLRREPGAAPPAFLFAAYRRNPGDFWLNVELAEWHLKVSNQFQEARSYFRVCRAINPNNPFVEHRLARVQLELQQFDEALFHISEALRLRPEYGLLHYHAGLILEKMNLPHAATEEYRKATILEPEKFHYLAWNNLGLLYLSRDQLRLAGRCFNETIRLNPDFPGGYVNRAMIHLTHEEIEPAFADLQTARQLDPSMKEIGVNLLNLLIQCGEFDEAISTGSILKLRLPDDQKLHLNLGAAYGMIGDAKHAAEAFEAITKKYPNYALAWYNRGQAEIELGQFEAAIESLRRADELGKKLQKWSYPSSQALSEAKLLEELLKRLPEALDGRRPPREAKELIHFAHVATTREKFDAAAQWYEKLFTLDPQAKSDLDLRLSAIGAAARSEKHRDLALRWLKEVLKELADEPWEKDARAARSVRHELQRLKFAMALAPVRDGKAISEEWERFWTDFETLRKRVRERIPVTFSE